MKRFFRILVSLLSFIVIFGSLLEAESGFNLYRRGEKEGAKAAFESELKAARETKNERVIWHALMGSAWHADETGEHKDAITYSNEALEVASKIDDPFMIGRSLTWLGWAYSSMGRYQTAVEFYNEAVRIGAPNGKITIIPVWGLANQELGAIYFKMGDTARAKETLEHTVKVARDYNVLAGIAEGATHLALINLTTGEVDTAWRWAKEAVDAAIECACSPYNLARARVVKAKVGLEKLNRKALSRETVIELIDQALEYSEKVGVKTCLAEAKIIKSKTLPLNDFNARYNLVSDALIILSGSESELRGTAESNVGELFLEQNKQEYAELYLKQGLKVNEEMLRKVDQAKILTTIANLEGLKGEQKKELEEFKKATDIALSTGELPLALKNTERLAESFLSLGYDRMASRWYRAYIDTINKMIEKEEQEQIRDELIKKRLAMMERYSSLAIDLLTEADPPLS